MARDRLHQPDVVHVLQRPAPLLRVWRHPGQHKQRRTRHVRVGNAGHGIGEAGACGHQRDAKIAGEFGMGLRHMYRGALVAHIDDADAFEIGAHPDRHDVAAAQREYAIHASCPQEPRDNGRAAIVRQLHGIFLTALLRIAKGDASFSPHAERTCNSRKSSA